MRLYLNAALEKLETHAPSLTDLAAIDIDRFKLPLANSGERALGEIFAGTGRFDLRIGDGAGRSDVDPDAESYFAVNRAFCLIRNLGQRLFHDS